MSQEKLEVVRRFIDAYNAGGLDAAVDFCAADVTVFPDASVFPESSSLVGRDEFRGFLAETWSAWASGGVTPTEVLDIPEQEKTAYVAFDLPPSVLRGHPQLRFKELGFGDAKGYIALPSL